MLLQLFIVIEFRAGMDHARGEGEGEGEGVGACPDIFAIKWLGLDINVASQESRDSY